MMDPCQCTGTPDGKPLTNEEITKGLRHRELLITLETALRETFSTERDVAVLHEWQEQQRQNVAELEAALDFERSQVARLMDLLIETQANENHYKRALATVWSALGVDARLAIEEEFDEAGLWARRAQEAARVLMVRETEAALEADGGGQQP